jgi:hypothetical protein
MSESDGQAMRDRWVMLLAARFSGLLTKPVAQSYVNPADFFGSGLYR